jgi:hypothetical protein
MAENGHGNGGHDSITEANGQTSVPGQPELPSRPATVSPEEPPPGRGFMSQPLAAHYPMISRERFDGGTELVGDSPHTRSIQFAKFQADAPACDNCGAITVRNGNCYLCHNCGNSMGCS